MANNYQYLDSNGLTTLWGIIKNRFGQIDGIFLGGSGATAGISNKMATIQTFGPASAGAAGSVGLVPAPGSGKQNTFLRGDGEWAAPVGSTYAAGTYLTLSGTTFNHDNSGVTAGSKGDTSAKTPGFGGTFKALSGTVDAQGHLTAFAEHNVTIPSATATTAANGLMSSTDKIKLDSVASSAEVNQNAFNTIKVGSISVVADTKTDTLNLAGSGSVSVTANASTDTITISGTNTTYAVATTAANGLLSAADKEKIDNLDEKYVPIQHIGSISTATINYQQDIIKLSTSSTWSGYNQFINIEQGEYPKISIGQSWESSSDPSIYHTSSIKLGGYVSNIPGIIIYDTDKIQIGTETTSGVYITQVADPINEQDAANKRYVDASNVIEKIQKNGTDLTITNKTVNIGVPTSVSQLSNDSGFITTADIPQGAAGSTTTPKMDGTAAVGIELAFARGDHVHPTDTSRAPVASPHLTGTPTVPTPGASSTATMIANKKYVDDSISAAISGAASFQGTATSTYPAAIENHEAGQYWLVTQDGKYVDGAFECQPGDMIFAIATAGTTADFTVIQQNLSPITTDDINTICV